MLIPLISLVFLVIIAVITFAFLNKSRALLGVLTIILWLLSLTSAFFAVWAWLERGYSENWAMYGFFFISLPIMSLVLLTSVAAIIGAKLRKIENAGKVMLWLYILLAFVLAQAAMGFLAGV